MRIVIDPGHGSKDPGAIGINNIAEKDVTLRVGHLLAARLREKGCDVFLTRDTDLFVSLPMRTLQINELQPDAYISIHANSAVSDTVQGIETYCLHADLFSLFAGVDTHAMLFKKAVQSRYEKSRQLADLVHARLIMSLSSYRVQDRKVKYAVSQLLLGTNVPGILVEVGFVTNPVEAVRLANAEYQEKLAHALCEGLLACLQA